MIVIASLDWSDEKPSGRDRVFLALLCALALNIAIRTFAGHFFTLKVRVPKLSSIPGLLPVVHALIYLTTTPYDGAIKGGLHLARVWRARGRVSDRTDFFWKA